MAVNGQFSAEEIEKMRGSDGGRAPYVAPAFGRLVAAEYHSALRQRLGGGWGLFVGGDE
ncbi:MAG TPA: hypothetical protein VIO61_04915 [Anaerolineaceae bacterium]